MGDNETKFNDDVTLPDLHESNTTLHIRQEKTILSRKCTSTKMELGRPYDTLQNKNILVRRWAHGEEFGERRPSDVTFASENEKRPFSRYRSPSPWLSRSLQSRMRWPSHRSSSPIRKPGFQRYGTSTPRSQPYSGEEADPKMTRAQREREKERQRARERENEKKRSKDKVNKSSPPKENSTTLESIFPTLSPSRERENLVVHLNVSSKSMGEQSREGDREGSRSQEREREGEMEPELPVTVSRATARNMAIQEQRREIEKVYRHDCEMFGAVVKMLIAKDPSLEQPLHLPLQESLREIGTRGVEAMQRFIDEYDSREASA